MSNRLPLEPKAILGQDKIEQTTHMPFERAKHTGANVIGEAV
ncbi:hypothetical protein [Stenomitos frigidus]|nr:hypothetical protein [Stenomitos frigidus]